MSQFDQHLSNAFEMPQTRGHLSLKGSLPVLSVTVDPGKEIESVVVYFTQQGVMQEKERRINPKHQTCFFEVCPTQLEPEAKPVIAETLIFSIERPLWVYAMCDTDWIMLLRGKVYYGLQNNHFTLSSLLNGFEDLEKIGVLYDS